MFSWPNPGVKISSEGAIAVDNSTNPLDPSKGDVYVVDDGYHVVDKFTASGAYLGQVTGTSPTSPFGEDAGLQAVAVDSNGALWIESNDVIYQFNDALGQRIRVDAQAGDPK